MPIFSKKLSINDLFTLKQGECLITYNDLTGTKLSKMPAEVLDYIKT